jgi:type VI secretion system secreted protein VgrG
MPDSLFYQMILRPWLAFLCHRSDNYLFHDKTLEAQTTAIFADYEALCDWKTEHLGQDVAMTDACQWDESDYNYLHRRWEAKGWHYHYEHRRDGHTLVLSGDSTRCVPIDGGGNIPWQGNSGVQTCGISQFSAVRDVMPTHYAASSFDFKNPRPIQCELPSNNMQGEIPALEIYEYAGAYGFKNAEDGDAFVRIRMEEIEARAKRFEARGNEDHAQPGRAFTLSGHLDAATFEQDAADDEQTFLIVAVEHVASNNYETGAGTASEYSNTITCIRKKIPYRPGRHFNSTPSRNDTIDTAIVVGPAGEEIHTDEYGRVRIQYHWDRVGRHDEKSSAWARVSSSFAGERYGQKTIPRIGQEVAVQWLGGDPDRPLITGRVYNARHMPPRFSHTGSLPGEKAVSGWSTRELHGVRLQQLRFDDTPGQISTQLASEHAHSQLNLGELRHPRNDGQAAPRGEGWEGCTGGHLVQRGGSGVFISADAQAHAGGAMLERGPLLGLADVLHSIQRQLSELSGTHHAETTDGTKLAQIIKQLNDWDGGTNVNPQGAGGGAPMVAVSAPAGIGIASGDNLLGAQTHIDAVSAGHTQITAGRKLLQRAAENISMFAHTLGIKLVAAAGKIEIQAHGDDIRITTPRNIVLTAGEAIVLQAPVIRQVAQGAQTDVGNGAITQQSSGGHTIQSPNFAHVGPGGSSPPGVAPLQSSLQTDEKFVLVRRGSGRPAVNRRYRIELDDGRSIDGVSDEQGRTQLAQDQAFKITRIILLKD